MIRSGTRIRDCGGRIMGIGDWAQSPIPIPNPHNPSTTIPNPDTILFKIRIFFFFFFFIYLDGTSNLWCARHILLVPSGVMMEYPIFTRGSIMVLGVPFSCENLHIK